MSTCVFQIIIQQWDKSELSSSHVNDREKQAQRRQLGRDSTFYAFDKQCVIDKQGDDLTGKRITYKRIDEHTIQIDRYTIDLNTQQMNYVGVDDDAQPSVNLGSLEQRFIQCKYQWRYRVFEGGFYYWLYEQIIVNAICTDTLDADIFLEREPDVIYDELV